MQIICSICKQNSWWKVVDGLRHKEEIASLGLMYELCNYRRNTCYLLDGRLIIKGQIWVCHWSGNFCHEKNLQLNMQLKVSVVWMKAPPKWGFYPHTSSARLSSSGDWTKSRYGTEGWFLIRTGATDLQGLGCPPEVFFIVVGRSFNLG